MANKNGNGTSPTNFDDSVSDRPSRRQVLKAAAAGSLAALPFPLAKLAFPAHAAGVVHRYAAGLPILPGLARYQEDASGVINHALRFTAPSTCAGHIYPARHDAGSGSCAALPPMGLRLRLKAGFDISGYRGQSRVILTALKRYEIFAGREHSALFPSSLHQQQVYWTALSVPAASHPIFTGLMVSPATVA